MYKQVEFYFKELVGTDKSEICRAAWVARNSGESWCSLESEIQKADQQAGNVCRMSVLQS